MIDYIKILKKNPVNPMAPKRTYAQAQSRETIDINGLASHMADHNCPFTRGTVKAVLDDAISCITELLLAGNIVQLGDLGKFSVTLSSKGVCESEIDILTGNKPVFTSENITAVNLRWKPGKEMRNLRDKATFNEVTTRKAKSVSLATKHDQMVDGTYEGDKALTEKKPGVSEID